MRGRSVLSALRTYVDLSSPAAAVESWHKLRLLRQVGPYTVVSRSKLNLLWNLARELDRRAIPGAVVECGVFRGGSAAVLGRASSAARLLYLFDSFQGLPKPGDKDGAQAAAGFHEGWCQGDADEVRALLVRLGVSDERIRIVSGWFADTLPGAGTGTIALLHIDADWYDPVRFCLNTLYDRVSPGGYVVLDDYGRWEGCTRAADEFLAGRGLMSLLPNSGPLPHYFRKPGD